VCCRAERAVRVVRRYRRRGDVGTWVSEGFSLAKANFYIPPWAMGTDRSEQLKITRIARRGLLTSRLPLQGLGWRLFWRRI